ncbi:UDP-N-acetylglucosamine 2-epimerase [Paracoccaceae bacterium]|nr:UDP-N-acetylglucosamine 2-epimerase [Paracoccaceae bacterium]
MRRKICIVTGTRAEFGLLRWLMESIKNHSELTLQVVATGAHLSPEFGCTYHEIEEAGFEIDAKVEMLLSSDTSTSIAKSMGLGTIGFADAYENLAPDVLVVLGDRFEIFAATSAAMIVGIPIAHIHGGETTEGAFDETIRHCITKMSQLHFVATEEYRQRVIQLGENPSNVFHVGGMGIDAIKRVKLLDKQELETALDFKLGNRNLLVTFHPATRDVVKSPADQMKELLAALAELKNTNLIFTMPNADTGGRALGALVSKFAEKHPNTVVYNSLGQLRYFSCLAHVDGVVGNSSSGLLEAPSFRIGTVNIGSRQKGRVRADSVVNCSSDRDQIAKAIEIILSDDFKKKIKNITNPYGDGHAVEKIINVLEIIDPQKSVTKEFYNIKPITIDRN